MGGPHSRFACRRRGHQEWLRRWYLENQNPPSDQRSYWITVVPATPREIAKNAELTQNGPISTSTSSVPNPRSREVGRKTAGEREFRVSTAASQCGGLRTEAGVN